MTNSEDTGFLEVIAKLISGDTLGNFLGAKLES